jgi:hypothetical protein
MVLLFLVVVASSVSFNTVYATTADADNNAYVPRYEVNTPNWSEDELIQYYIDNKIFPANIQPGVGAALIEANVGNHLQNRNPSYTGWHRSYGNSVGYVYGGDPIETYEYDTDIQAAKNLAGITYNYIGCGPLSMVTQFDYLARYAGYPSIARDPSTTYHRRVLAQEIFERTPTIAADSPLAQFFGADPNGGTFTFPTSVIGVSRNILRDKGLAIQKTATREDGSTYTYYDRDSQIYVYGDEIPSLKSFSNKINDLKDSIDRGMPVIWWTLTNVEDFSGHYMNIFAYEYWIGTDTSGNTKTHLMFKLRTNWGDPDIYMDSDTLNAVNCGFIYFEEIHEKALFTKENYSNWECQYFFYEKQSYITPTMGNKVAYTNRLRTGYIDHYDSTNTYVDAQYLTLSARRQGAGQAYIEYTFNTPVEHIYVFARWWSSSEGMGIYGGDALIQYLDSNGTWVTAFDIQEDIDTTYLSTLEEYPTGISCRFDEPTYTFRFYVEAFNPSGDRNKGRLVIEEMNVFFSTEI